MASKIHIKIIFHAQVRIVNDITNYCNSLTQIGTKTRRNCINTEINFFYRYEIIYFIPFPLIEKSDLVSIWNLW